MSPARGVSTKVRTNGESSSRSLPVPRHGSQAASCESPDMGAERPAITNGLLRARCSVSWGVAAVSKTAQSRPSRRLESLANAADYAGVTTRTMRRYIASGRLVGYRVGPRLIRIDLDELEAMLKPIPATSGDAG
jgi:excisionase family DNA binding protein